MLGIALRLLDVTLDGIDPLGLFLLTGGTEPKFSSLSFGLQLELKVIRVFVEADRHLVEVEVQDSLHS